MGKSDTSGKKAGHQKSAPQRGERTHFSKATMEVAKSNLEKSRSQSDEGFLIRADMDRKLSSL